MKQLSTATLGASHVPDRCRHPRSSTPAVSYSLTSLYSPGLGLCIRVDVVLVIETAIEGTTLVPCLDAAFLTFFLEPFLVSSVPRRLLLVRCLLDSLYRGLPVVPAS